MGVRGQTSNGQNDATIPLAQPAVTDRHRGQFLVLSRLFHCSPTAAGAPPGTHVPKTWAGLEGPGASGCDHAALMLGSTHRTEGGPPPRDAHRQETHVARRLLLAATGAIALVAAGLGTATADAAAPTAGTAKITTRRACT